MNLEQLLSEGRAILAEKRRKEDEKERSRADAAKLKFDWLRRVAVEELDTEAVEPFEMPEGWKPWEDWNKGIHWFWYRPLEDGGCVGVKLRIYDDPLPPHHEDHRCRFYVEHNFRIVDGSEPMRAMGQSFHATDSLAEALALCEEEGANYRACIAAQLQANINASAHREESRKKVVTPAENLLFALEEWINTLDRGES